MNFRSSYATSALALASISIAGVGGMVGLGLGVEGCTVLTNDALPDDAGTFEGGGDSGPPSACTSCVAEECTGAWSVCLTDNRCVALRACDSPLGESAAGRAQCFCDGADASASTPDGGADPLAAYGAFAACNDARTCGKCAADCTSVCANGARKTTAGACGSDLDAGDAGDGGDAGDAGDAGVDLDAGDDASDGAPPPPPSADSCSSCTAARCGDSKKACATGSECSTFLGCVYGCFDGACVDACGKAHSTGKASATELASCTLTSCRSACGY